MDSDQKIIYTPEQIRSAWVSQYDEARVPSAGPTACFRTCRVICGMLGLRMPEGTVQRWQLALGEDLYGNVRAYDQYETEAAKIYVDCGNPVIAGVNYKSGSMNRDHITDHYVVMLKHDGKYIGLNPGAPLFSETFYNYQFDWLPDGHWNPDPDVSGYWRKTGSSGITVSMIVPEIGVAKTLVERP